MIIRDVKVPIFPDIPRAVIPAKAGIQEEPAVNDHRTGNGSKEPLLSNSWGCYPLRVFYCNRAFAGSRPSPG